MMMMAFWSTLALTSEPEGMGKRDDLTGGVTACPWALEEGVSIVTRGEEGAWLRVMVIAERKREGW